CDSAIWTGVRNMAICSVWTKSCKHGHRSWRPCPPRKSKVKLRRLSVTAVRENGRCLYRGQRPFFVVASIGTQRSLNTLKQVRRETLLHHCAAAQQPPSVLDGARTSILWIFQYGTLTPPRPPPVMAWSD